MRSKREIWRLEEHLIPATLERINQEIGKRPELKKMLNKPIKDLNSKYLNLFEPDVLDDYKNNTLYEVIRGILTRHTAVTTTNSVYFYSETVDNWLEGFAYYDVSMTSSTVINIGIFSFNEKVSSFTLARDVIRLLNELTEKYQLIRFLCTEDQPMLKHYILETEKRNGAWEYDSDEGLYYFEVPGKKMLERLVRHGYAYDHGDVRRCQ